MTEKSTMNGTKHKTISVSATFSANIATKTPTTMNIFLTRFTSSAVNISEIAFVSFVVLVTSLPTGMEFICSCERLSIWVKRSSRILEIIF